MEADRTIELLRQAVHVETLELFEKDVAGRKAEGRRTSSGIEKKKAHDGRCEAVREKRDVSIAI